MAESATNPSGEPSILDQEAIVRAALRVVDQEGLDALTMRRLGAELGVEAMSLYHHVPNKAALLHSLVHSVLTIEVVPSAGGLPLDEVADAARRIRHRLRTHQRVIPLVIAEPPHELLDAMLDGARASLSSSGFDQQASSWIIDAVIGYVLGTVAMSTGAEIDDPRADATFETGLRLILLGLRDDLGLD